MGLSVVPGLPNTYSTSWAMRLSMRTCLPRMGGLLSGDDTRRCLSSRLRLELRTGAEIRRRCRAMSSPLRVVHYVNQFFGGIGGEDQAHVGVTVRAGAVGPGRALETALGEGARVEATIVCGDNFASEQAEDAARTIGDELDRLKPDVLVAGPAFGSGRYGLACALACKVAQDRGIAAITAMHPENPGASAARRGVWVAAKPWGSPRSTAICRAARAASTTAGARAISAPSTCCSTSSTGDPI